MEEVTGYLYTYNLHSQLRKILIEKGAFRQVFLTGKIVNCNNFLEKFIFLRNQRGRCSTLLIT